jgi:hypothetical protein
MQFMDVLLREKKGKKGGCEGGRKKGVRERGREKGRKERQMLGKRRGVILAIDKGIYKKI